MRSNSSARKPFITLITAISAATPSATAIEADRGDEEDEPLAAPGQQVAPGDHALVAGDHAVRRATAASTDISSRVPAPAALDLDRAGGDALGADDDLPRHADQVGRSELRPAALVAVVVQDFDTRRRQPDVESIGGGGAGRIVGAQVDQRDPVRRDRLGPDDAGGVVTRFDDRPDQARDADAVAAHVRHDRLAGGPLQRQAHRGRILVPK